MRKLLFAILFLLVGFYLIKQPRSYTQVARNISIHSKKNAVEEKNKVEPKIVNQKNEVSPQECQRIVENFDLDKQGFNCVVYKFSGQYDVLERKKSQKILDSLDINLEIDPDDLKPGEALPRLLKVAMVVNRFDEKRDDYFPAIKNNLQINFKDDEEAKKFVLDVSDPPIETYILSQLGFDPKVAVLLRNSNFSQDHCYHATDPAQWIETGSHWISTDLKGVVLDPTRKSYVNIEYEGGSFPTYNCNLVANGELAR
jgi:hypothetical protein